MNKESKYYIYVLSLENNKYYVGKTIGDLDDCITPSHIYQRSK